MARGEITQHRVIGGVLRSRPRMTVEDYLTEDERLGRTVMRPITMDKDVLLKILQDNRAKHRQVFEDALEGYAAEARTVLGDHLDALRDGKTPDIHIILLRPEDHTKDYDRVIGMLRFHLGTTFELDEQSYKQYVDDDWAWKRQWIDTASQYAVGSVQANYGG